jgi:hypothetical protein
MPTEPISAPLPVVSLPAIAASSNGAASNVRLSISMWPIDTFRYVGIAAPPKRARPYVARPRLNHE